MSEIIGPVAAELLKHYGPAGGCFVLLVLLYVSERTRKLQAERYAEKLSKLYEKLDVVQEKRIADTSEGIRAIERAGSAFALALNFISKGRDDARR